MLIILDIGLYLLIGLLVWTLYPLLFWMFRSYADYEHYNPNCHVDAFLLFIILWPIPLIFTMLNFPIFLLRRYAEAWAKFWS